MKLNLYWMNFNMNVLTKEIIKEIVNVANRYFLKASVKRVITDYINVKEMGLKGQKNYITLMRCF